MEYGYISLSEVDKPTLWLNEVEEWANRDSRAVHEKITYFDRIKAQPGADISFIPSSDQAAE